MNQAFFTLSVGMGGMAIFGSYIEKEHSLMGESVHIIVLDTLVAVLAGIIMFPACFTYGVDQTSGPSLIFITLPNIFANMPYGRCGEACSSCSWRSQLCLQYWRYLKISSAVVWN